MVGPRASGAPVSAPEHGLQSAEWIGEVKGISVLELSERIAVLEEESGVSARPPRSRPRSTAVLTGAGDEKIQVIKVVRAATGLGLEEAGRASRSSSAAERAPRCSAATALELRVDVGMMATIPDRRQHRPGMRDKTS